MANNSIENNTIKNSEINQTVNNIFFFGLEKLPPEIIEQLKEMYPDEFKNSKDEEIKEEIEKLYKDAMKIVNIEEASLYISQKNIDKLKSIYQKLEILEIYYKGTSNSEEAKQYYHNLFVILARINLLEAIKKFDKFPEDIKKNDGMIYLYATFSITLQDKLEKAENILYNLYYNKKFDVAFESLVRCYFLQKKYDKVVELLSKAKKEQFDRYGFLASIYIISKNFIKQFKETEILKYNKNKFKNMPLFYAAKANVLYFINPKNSKIKEQFKNGLKYLNAKDVIAINTMCNVAKNIKLNEEMIKFLLNIELTPYLKICLSEFLVNKPILSKKEIDKLKEIKEDINEQDIDSNYIDGILFENQGQEIKAIGQYEESYYKKGTINSAYKYIELSRKNFCEIKETVLKKLSLNSDLNSIMIVVEGYKYKNDFENAIRNSYKALYLLNNKTANKEVLRQYWGCIMLGGDILYREVTSVGKDVGVALKSDINSKVKNIVIEDDTFYQENRKIMNVEIIRSTSDLGLELINKKVNDKILYKNQTYKIISIKDKYTFFSHICFEKIEKTSDIEIFKTNEKDMEGFIEQLKQKLIEIQKVTDERLDIYEKSGNVPLSAYFSSEKNANDYAKIINTLLNEKERVFYAGEPKDINVEKGFVIDLTSILVLALFDKLEVFTHELCQKVYITTSLKNKIKYYYESLLEKQGKKETTIGVIKQEDGTQMLAMNEMEINERIRFWANIYKCVNKFKIEDVEAVKDDIWNIDRNDCLDKVQFDLIALAKRKELPYICDDLLIRKLAGGVYKIDNTNCLVLIEHLYKDCYDKYIDVVTNLVQCNYIYVLYSGKYIGNIFLYLYQNYEEELKLKVEKILKEVLKTKLMFDSHIGILINMINNLKKVQFTKILDNVYINEKITDIINMIIKNIQDACNNLKLNYKEYEKYISKEYGGIELKIE